MATVSFSPAGDVLYAYLAGEIDHDAAQSLRIQLDDALVSRAPQTMILDLCCVFRFHGLFLLLSCIRAGDARQLQHLCQLGRCVLHPQCRAQCAGNALPPQDQPYTG